MIGLPAQEKFHQFHLNNYDTSIGWKGYTSTTKFKSLKGLLFVVIFTGLRNGQYDQIIRWWSYNLGQGSLQS